MGQQKGQGNHHLFPAEKKSITQEQVGSQILTILMEKLKNGRLLGIEEECGHVVVGLIGTKKGLDA